MKREVVIKALVKASKEPLEFVELVKKHVSCLLFTAICIQWSQRFCGWLELVQHTSKLACSISPYFIG